MNKFKYIILFVLIDFLCISTVLADSSKFEPILTMPGDITEDEVVVLLGFAGEDIMVINNKLTYDSRYLELVNVQALENFNVTVSDESTEGKWTTVNILGDSMYSFKETNYAIVTFKVLDKFKVNKKVDVFFYDYEAAGSEKYKYRSSGMLFEMQRETQSNMIYITKNCDTAMKIEYWCVSHWYIFVIGLLIIIGIVAFIILFPGKRYKEKREDKIREEMNQKKVSSGNIDPVKINMEAIDSIGKENEEKDMSGAITVGEVAAFKDNTAEAKFDHINQANQNANNSQIPTNLDAFDMNANIQKPNTDVIDIDEIDNKEQANQNANPENLVLFQPKFEENQNEENNNNM